MSVKVKYIIEKLNDLAPECLAQDWDNVGLQVGSVDNKVSRILLALDATSRVIEEAIQIKADMIITHHPMIFTPLKKIIKDDHMGENIYRLIENNINLYVMHTNLDTAFGGTNDILGNIIDLYNTKVLNPDEKGMGIGRIGDIKQTTIKELSHRLKKELRISQVRVVADLDQDVKRVAICTGSGMSFIKNIIGKADVFITGDIKFHEAQEAREHGIGLIDVGHYASENIAMPSIKEYMEEFTLENNIKILISKIDEDPFTII